MKRLVLACLISSGLIAGASADECKIEGLRHYFVGTVLIIDGSTSCKCGRVTIRAFKGDKFVGADTTAFTKGYAFMGMIDQVPISPNLSFKTSIREETCR
jgi:hypothetical protein